MSQFNLSRLSDMLGQASAHAPMIFYTMTALNVFFLCSFIYSLYISSTKPYEQRSAWSSVLRYAPSVATAIGLLGTFWSLTIALGDLKTFDIKRFLTQLDGVFLFSLMGVGAAIVFMVMNFILSCVNTHNLHQSQNKQLQEQHINRTQILRQNQMVIDTLTTLKNETIQQNAQLSQILQMHLQELNQLVQQNSQHIHLQQQWFQNLSQSLNKMGTGYDTEKLGRTLSQNITSALKQPTERVRKNQSNQSIPNDVLYELKTDVLEPIRNEIKTHQHQIGLVTQAINNSNKVNELLLKGLNNVNQNIQQISKNMNHTIQQMHDTQKEQKNMLKNFNTELSYNLNKIEPAIQYSFQSAEKQWIQAINHATNNMNHTLKMSHNQIEKVVNGLNQSINTLKSTDLERPRFSNHR